MSPRHDRGPAGNLRFPRMSGDEPGVLMLTISITKFSPRERG